MSEKQPKPVHTESVETESIPEIDPEDLAEMISQIPVLEEMLADQRRELETLQNGSGEATTHIQELRAEIEELIIEIEGRKDADIYDKTLTIPESGGSDDWLHTEVGEPVRALIRNGKGWEALEKARDAGLPINYRLISSALDATSMSLAFARQRKNEKEIQMLEDELLRITEKWGDPTHR